MKYFTIKELTRSETAAKYKVDNTPGTGHVKALTLLVENVLDPLREAYGKPIRVNSGYRNAAVNRLVGGSKTSQHMSGEAADITGGSVTENMKLFKLIQTLGLPYDQLIDEYGYSWVHVSYREQGNRKRILHLG